MKHQFMVLERLKCFIKMYNETRGLVNKAVMFPKSGRPMKYVKEYWDESRGDDYDHWGETWYYFEVNESDSYANRQICVYTNGNSLKYDMGDCIDDEYGFLCDQPIEINEGTIEISQAEFEEIWKKTGKVDGVSQW